MCEMASNNFYFNLRDGRINSTFKLPNLTGLWFLKCSNYKHNLVFVDTCTDRLMYDSVFGMQVKCKIESNNKKEDMALYRK